jgi:hypothetical protein
MVELAIVVIDLSIDTFIITSMDYQKYLTAASEILNEIKALDEQKKAIDAKMTKLSALFLANINLLPEEVRKGIANLYEAIKAPRGLTAAVLMVLTSEMSAAEVRDALIASGYDFSGQVNPLASVGTTLKRLADDEKILSREAEGRTVYKMKMPPRTRFPKLQMPKPPK